MQNTTIRRLARSLVAITLVAFLAACQSAANLPAPAPTASGAASPGQPVAVAGGSYLNISSQQLKTMLDRKDFLLVDVHIPNEGHLAGTDLRIPYNQIEQNVGKLPMQKDARIVLYCMSGRMSAIAAEKLVALGYRNVWNLERGMVEWRQQGYALLAD
ncbi:MAG: rhodanese-like domain-containing protein [Chloroflexi bacterium]|nr:rhodanese-like domain-containing protein [Chloroflexota bacterium]